ncbi:tyrosinase isoform X2 [Lates calcarifer]|uniref:Tyrosinase n=1 Tax=Lates calcarifer TaxID=8187 RepID=A0AAJ7V7P9_LATCA|nr:tyrosinase isoform X2 [Lates calcarifer]
MMLSFQWFRLVLVFYPMSLRGVEAQFPRSCTTPEALQTRECCPPWNGSPCGFSSGRGVCAPHPARDLPKPVDYRVNWPRAFYDSVCTCWGNYDGSDCGQCLPGWRGPQCQQRHHVERKEITDLTDSERETFLSSLHQAKQSLSSRYNILTSNDTTVDGNYAFQNTSVYNLYVWMHYYSAKSYAGSENNAAHRGPAFLFWHRVFLLFIEREIRELTGNQDFYIPYWDWTRTNHCNICTNKYFGGVREDGRIDSASLFSKWKTICPFQESLGIICIHSDASDPAHLIRNPGKDPIYKTLPTAADVEDTMATPLFDTPPFDITSKNSFRSKLEGFQIPSDSRHLNASMHNLVHRYFNGTMSLVPTAANDPIFMLHHSFIDKLLERWLQDHSEATYPESDQVHPAQRAQAYMAPFFPLRTNNYYLGRDTKSLGYSYKEHSLSRSAAGHITATQAEEFLEESSASGVQWQWPVLGVFSIVLLCVSVGAAITCKDKRQQTQNAQTEERQSEFDCRSNSLYAVWVKERNESTDKSSCSVDAAFCGEGVESAVNVGMDLWSQRDGE